MEIWAISWSGGKDSALALDRAVRAGLDVRYLATLYDPASGRVRFHGTPVQVLEMQAVALGASCLATLPWCRGRGIGRAITLAPLLDGQARGYHIGTLQASEAGYPVYRRLGFDELSTYRFLLWPPVG